MVEDSIFPIDDVVSVAQEGATEDMWKGSWNDLNEQSNFEPVKVDAGPDYSSDGDRDTIDECNFESLVWE